jgi:hypothetical protein
VSRTVEGLTLRDPAGIVPAVPCVAKDVQTVVCPNPGGFELQISLGDGDDTLSGGTVRGGPGVTT